MKGYYENKFNIYAESILGVGAVKNVVVGLDKICFELLSHNDAKILSNELKKKLTNSCIQAINKFLTIYLK